MQTVTVYLNDTDTCYAFDNVSVLYTDNWVHIEDDEGETIVFPARRIHKVIVNE